MRSKSLIKIAILLIALLVILQIGNLFLKFGEDYSLVIKDEFLGLNEGDFANAAEKATPSVVFISAGDKSGSGVIIREDGIIITNNHVVENSTNISVRLGDKRIFKGEIIGGDKGVDIAILKINADNLAALEFADSDKVEVGQPVLAIGNPYGYDFTVTTGIISAKHRERGPTEFRDFLQTDTSINPGNSGGPLVDLNARIVGINTFIVSDERAGELGFAIPSNLVGNIVEQILKYGKVERGFMGLIVRDVVDLDENGTGMILEGSLVEQVLEDGPSYMAGIKIGDFITKINSKKIDGSNVLRNLIASYRPGENVTVTIDRNGTILEIRMELGKRPE